MNTERERELDRQEVLRKLTRLVDTFKENINEYHSSNNVFSEAATRTEYLDPFLKLLGWDISNEEGRSYFDRAIVPEEPRNSTDRPDYTAKLNGVDVLFFEAKKPRVNIASGPESANQARRYGWNAGHKVSVLTNFEYLAIYETTAEPKEDDNAIKYRYKLFHYEEYVSRFDEIYDLISYASLINGRFEEWTSSITRESASTTSLDKVFLDKLNDWRLKIGNDLYNSGCPQYRNAKKINDDVQTFLNQLIFLRFAEDNHFEDQETLLNKSVDRNLFIDLLDESEKKYNSGIFEEMDIINSLSTETITNIIEQLYYPESSYDFKIINLMILGNIYENFLQHELAFADGGMELVKTKQARIKSIVPTPEHLVRYISKKALEERIKGKSPEEILQLRIGDLAVGSGTFLVGAFDYIEDYLIDWYSNKNEMYPSRSIVPYHVKRELIEQVLVGFDIDFHAVQLTKFSLVLRLLRHEKRERLRNFRPILPSLVNNIICGNSLVSEDDVDFSIISLEEQIEINPMEQGYSELKFDVVLGNPPYLKKEDIVNSTQSKEQDIYSSKFESSYQMYDKYFLFVESALKRIKEDGNIVLLIPNKFWTVKAGMKLRILLKREEIIKEIIDFGDLQLFNGRVTYLSVVSFKQNSELAIEYGKVNSLQSLMYVNTLRFPIDLLDDDLWFLTDDASFVEKYNLARRFPFLTEEYKIFTGIQSSKNDVYAFYDSERVDETTDLFIYERNGLRIPIEKVILKKFYKPARRESHFSYQPLISEKRIIFPYDNGVLYSKEQMKSEYPNAWAYLESQYDELLPRHLGGNRSVPNATLDTWYQYGRTQNLGIAEYPSKVLVGVNSNKPNFNIDESQTLYESGGTAGYVAIVKKADSQYTHEYLVAWLSHPFADRIAQVFGSTFEGGFYSRGANLLKKMPLLPIDFSSKIEVEKFNKINQLVENIYEVANQLEEATDYSVIRALNMRRNRFITVVNGLIDDLLAMKGIVMENES